MPSNKLPDFTFEVKEINDATNTVTISVDKASLSKAIGRIAPYKALPYTFRPALEGVSKYVRMVMIPNVFQNEGPGWAPLARRTVAERIQAGYGGRHPILQRSGDLFKELTDRNHPNHIEIIKVGKYARIEIGGSSAKFRQNQKGQGIGNQKLPQRAMIPGTGNVPIPNRDRLAIKAILVGAIRQNAGRPG